MKDLVFNSISYLLLSSVLVSSKHLVFNNRTSFLLKKNTSSSVLFCLQQNIFSFKEEHQLFCSLLKDLVFWFFIKKTPEHQNTRTPEHQNTRTPEHQNTRTTKQQPFFLSSVFSSTHIIKKAFL